MFGYPYLPWHIPILQIPRCPKKSRKKSPGNSREKSEIPGKLQGKFPVNIRRSCRQVKQEPRRPNIQIKKIYCIGTWSFVVCTCLRSDQEVTVRTDIPTSAVWNPGKKVLFPGEKKGMYIWGIHYVWGSRNECNARRSRWPITLLRPNLTINTVQVTVTCDNTKLVDAVMSLPGCSNSAFNCIKMRSSA